MAYKADTVANICRNKTETMSLFLMSGSSKRTIACKFGGLPYLVLNWLVGVLNTVLMQLFDCIYKE